MAKKSLAAWIAEAINDPDKDAKITHLTLHHMVGAVQREIHTYKFSSNGVEPKALADMFEGKATTFAQDLGTAQTFMLCAYYGSTVAGAMHPFVIRSASEVSGLTTEAGTPEGQRMQSMRHHETGMGHIFQRQAQLDEHAMKMLQRSESMLQISQAANSQLIADNMSAFVILKDLMFERENKRHENEMREAQFRRDSEDRAKLMTFVPALANTITGTDVFPQGTADTALVETIASALKPEHLPLLGQLGLPDTVLASLASRVTKVMDENRKKDETRAQLPRYSGSAEDDVTGGGSLQ
jgi:hypothetical protein